MASQEEQIGEPEPMTDGKGVTVTIRRGRLYAAGAGRNEEEAIAEARRAFAEYEARPAWRKEFSLGLPISLWSIAFEGAYLQGTICMIDDERREITVRIGPSSG